MGCALEGRVLKIDIDGMDQAKFKVPRNLEATHSFAALWRPVLHVTCAIAHGLVEARAYGHKLAYMSLYKIAYMVRGTRAYILCCVFHPRRRTSSQTLTSARTQIRKGPS